MDLEFAILAWFQSIHCAPLDALAIFFDTIGAHGELWIVLAVVLLLFKRTRKTGVAVAVALLLHLFIGDRLIKPLIARPRPCDLNTAFTPLVPRPSGWSFPSGHTSSAFAAASALLFEKSRLAPYALVLAAFIGLTRLYLYVHFPTDVLAGVTTGLVFGFVAAKLVDALAARRAKHLS